MSTAAKSKPKPPARPPLPRGGLSLGGMSFKKLEQEGEGEEEDLTITGKYSSHLHKQPSLTTVSTDAQSQQSDPSPTLGSSSAKAAKGTEKDTKMSSSAQKKVFEYKELLSGLKGKIQDKINKTIEDFSSDSASPGSDKGNVNVQSGSSGKKLDAPNTESETPESSKQAAASSRVTARLQKSNTDPLIKAIPKSTIARARSEEKQDTKEKETTFQPLQLSLITDEVSGEENILITDEHFKRDLQDSETNLRIRSNCTEQKYPSKTSQTADTSTATKKEEMGDKGINDTSDTLHQSMDTTPGNSTQKPVSSPQNSSFLCFIVHLGDHLTTRQKLAAIAVVIFTVFFLPIPSYLSGLIMGCMMTSLCLAVYSFVMQPAKVKQPAMIVPLAELPPMEIPEMKEATLLDGIYKGWMNEISSYNPDEYHFSQTSSIFITLTGTKLLLQKPKKPIPKRAMHDESTATSEFVHQRQFELKGSRVSLHPPGLIKKRLWSRKYPICIALAQPGTKTRIVEKLPEGVSANEDSNPKPETEQLGEKRCDTSVLFLFARTGREKEEWFHRFHAATQERPLANAILEMRRAIKSYRKSQHRRADCDGVPIQRRNSADSLSSTPPDTVDSAATEMETIDPVLEFTRYMGHLMPAATLTRLLTPSKTGKDGGANPRLPFPGSIICDSQLHWLNALIGRCFFDFLRDAWWADKVKDKLQRKLSKIHVPYFIEELQVTAIDLGKEMPVIRRAAYPYLDEQGFWVELDIAYSGGFKMTIETKVNLMKLKRNNPEQTASTTKEKSDRSPVTDPDEEDSAESSTDEEEEACPEEKESGGGSKKLLKYLDKLTSSKYFQQATEYKYIKRAMENVSNTPLQLQVSVKNLVGKLAINIPPAPSDRLWYGFRGVPRLCLVAKPQVGERVVSFTHVTEWIERKLESEFQRVFVMPNMDDLVIPILRASDGVDRADNSDSSPPPPSFSSLPVD